MSLALRFVSCFLLALPGALATLGSSAFAQASVASTTAQERARTELEAARAARDAH